MTSDLSDEDLQRLLAPVCHCELANTQRMAYELVRHRAARRADTELVRLVVDNAVYVEISKHGLASIQWADWGEIRRAIAHQAAEKLATPAGIGAEHIQQAVRDAANSIDSLAGHPALESLAARITTALTASLKELDAKRRSGDTSHSIVNELRKRLRGDQ